MPNFYDPDVNNQALLRAYREWRVIAIICGVFAVGSTAFVAFWQPPTGMMIVPFLAIFLSAMAVALVSALSLFGSLLFRVWPLRKELERLGVLPTK